MAESQFDKDVALAIKLSLEEEKQDHPEPFFDEEHCVKKRSELVRNDTHNVPESKGTTLRLVRSVNQFHDFWKDSIKQYNTASSICGYTTIAIAHILSEMLDLSTPMLPAEEMSKIEKAIRDPNFVLPYVNRAMEYIHDCRVAYCDKINLRGKKRKNYIQAWVANYEISDYFIEHRKDVHFARFNQTPEYKSATHEEKDRLSEEFGMGIDINTETLKLSKADVDSDFLWEYFVPQRELMTISEFQSSEKFNSGKKIICVDCNGHYVPALVGKLENEKTLLFFETTKNKFVFDTCRILPFIIDLCFYG